MKDTENSKVLTCAISLRPGPHEFERVLQLLVSVIAGTQAKRGCLDCAVGRDAVEKNALQYREEWDSEEAFHRHVQSDEFRCVLVAMDMCVEAPRVSIGSRQLTDGLETLRKLRESDDGA